MLQGNAPITFAQPQLFTSEQAIKLGLFFLILTILLTTFLYFIKSFQLVRNSSDYFHVLGSKCLGGKDKLILVNICDKTFVLACNDQHISKLHCFDEKIELPPPLPESNKFKVILSDMLCRNKN